MSTQAKSTKIRVKLIDHTYEDFDVSLLKFRVINDMMDALSDQKDAQKDAEIEFRITRELFDRAVKYIVHDIMDFSKVVCKDYYESFANEYLEILIFFHKYDFEDYDAFRKNFLESFARRFLVSSITNSRFGEKINRIGELICEYKYRQITIFYTNPCNGRYYYVKNQLEYERDVDYTTRDERPFDKCNMENMVFI